MKPAIGLVALLVMLPFAGVADGQEPATRAAVIEQAEGEKAAVLHPYKPNKAEEWINRSMAMALSGQVHWHPFWTSAYSGGGFTIGAGYMTHVSSYSTLDVRGSITFSGYKRAEAELFAPRLFNRRGTLTVLGGWREATQVGFYGLGTANTSKDNRANYGFQQPYASAALEVWPARTLFVLRGGLEAAQWKVGQPSGESVPRVEQIYTAASLPGLGAQPTYLHTRATVGIDSRTSPGYTRRGGFYGVTVHDFADTNTQFGFNQVDYEAIQHIPILREAWVISLRGFVQTTSAKSGQQVPFFMMPSLGGGSDLRAFSSWRFRDRNSLLLQAEWRVMVNRFFDTAIFVDAGKVTSRTADLNVTGLKSDYGLGFRMHGPASTPLRIELTNGNEGFALVFAASQVF